jgi:hypothetical protein
METDWQKSQELLHACRATVVLDERLVDMGLVPRLPHEQLLKPD